MHRGSGLAVGGGDHRTSGAPRRSCPYQAVSQLSRGAHPGEDLPSSSNACGGLGLVPPWACRYPWQGSRREGNAVHRRRRPLLTAYRRVAAGHRIRADGMCAPLLLPKPGSTAAHGPVWIDLGRGHRRLVVRSLPMSCSRWRRLRGSRSPQIGAAVRRCREPPAPASCRVQTRDGGAYRRDRDGVRCARGSASLSANSGAIVGALFAEEPCVCCRSETATCWTCKRPSIFGLAVLHSVCTSTWRSIRSPAVKPHFSIAGVVRGWQGPPTRCSTCATTACAGRRAACRRRVSRSRRGGDVDASDDIRTFIACGRS